MAFVNLSLLMGVALIGIPIALHLAMKRKPKLIEFPALQFVRQRRESNQRQLQLKHILLLMLRILAIAFLALALARPSVDRNSLGNWLIVGLLSFAVVAVALSALLVFVYQRGRGLMIGLSIVAVVLLFVDLWMVGEATAMTDSGLIGDHRAPVAAVLVIDSSARMLYEHENQTRLDRAKEMARWLIRQLPDDSEVAIIDSHEQRRVFSVDIAAAQQSIDLLETSFVAPTMPELVSQGLDLIKKSEKGRKEIYVFSDLSKAAWEADSQTAFQNSLQESGVSVYVVDVGVPQPTNFSIGSLDIPQDVITPNRDIQISTELIRIGDGDSRTVELLLEKIDATRPVIENGQALFPEAVPRHRELCTFGESNFRSVAFQLEGLEVGVHHGYIRLVGEDGLQIDDQRYFTIEVQEAWPVLVVEGNGATGDYLTSAIAPFQEGQRGAARYSCEIITQAELASTKLADFSAVFLLDPGAIPVEEWDRLQHYIQQGGGLAVCLGRNARRGQAFHNEIAVELLGGKLNIQYRSPDDFLEHQSNQHPVLSIFGNAASEVPWEYFPVNRHWVFDPLDGDSRTIIRLARNRQPILFEREVGRGRVIVFTTPLSDSRNRPDGGPWNELPIGESAWPFVGLMRGTAAYLVHSASTKLNYRSGETVRLTNDDRVEPNQYNFFTPDGRVQQIKATDGILSIRAAERPGTYRMKGDRGGIVLRGFSVNLPESDTDLTRTGDDALVATFGDFEFQLARSQDDIVFGVREKRVGREFYSYLLALVVLFLGLEHLLANRFYQAASGNQSNETTNWLKRLSSARQQTA